MPARVTLHEEIAAILSESGGGWMKTDHIADRVNARGRYRKRDGSPVTAFQIHGRTRNYGHLFERDGSRVRLRSDADAPVRLHPRPARRKATAATVAGLQAAPELVEKAVAALASPALTMDEAAPVAPRRPGLYAIRAADEGLAKLGVEGAGGVLYIGKAERSLHDRDVRQHFADGNTGRSTLRRSLAALLAGELDLVPVPRNPERPTAFDRYALDANSDRILTEWMREHLRLALWPAPQRTALRPIEIAAIQRLLPPLNLTDVVTPHTAAIKARRRVMADRARAWVVRRR
jgi:hypothetical protein